jgi:2-dehydropantoate 2-reductase
MPTTVLPAESLASLVWSKAIVNCAVNPLTALFRVRNGVLVDNVHCRALLERAVTEAVAVARADGVTLPFDDPVAHTLDGVSRDERRTARRCCATCCAAVPSESAQLNAELVRRAAAHGIAVPTHEFLVKRWRQSTAARRKKVSECDWRQM